LIANAKPKVVAIIDDATAYGKVWRTKSKKTLKAAGVKVLAREQGTTRRSTEGGPHEAEGRGPDAVSTAEWIHRRSPAQAG